MTELAIDLTRLDRDHFPICFAVDLARGLLARLPTSGEAWARLSGLQLQAGDPEASLEAATMAVTV